MISRKSKAPRTAPAGQAVRTSFAILALTFGASATAAFAQTAPAPAVQPAADQQAPASTPVTAPATTSSTAAASTSPAATTPSSNAPFTVDPKTILAQNTPAGVVPKQKPVGHYPIIDIVTTFSQPGVPFNQARGVSQYHAYDPIDVGGTVRIPITRTIYAAFDRITEGTLNQAVERTIIAPPVPPGSAAGVIYPGVSRDIILQYRLDEQFGRFLVEEGLSFRHRLYANDGSGVSTVPYLCAAGGTVHTAACTTSSTEHHFAYLGLTYTTPQIRELLHSSFALGLTGEAQHVDHNVATACSLTIIQHYTIKGCPAGGNTAIIGLLDENPTQDTVYESTQSVSWTIPVDIKHKTAFTTRERWGALNFYENQPFPFRWASALDLILTKTFSPGFTIALRHSDYHSIEMGTIGVDGTAPFGTFLSPNAIHVASFDVLGTFHFDTNSWFH